MKIFFFSLLLIHLFLSSPIRIVHETIDDQPPNSVVSITRKYLSFCWTFEPIQGYSGRIFGVYQTSFNLTVATCPDAAGRQRVIMKTASLSSAESCYNRFDLHLNHSECYAWTVAVDLRYMNESSAWKNVSVRSKMNKFHTEAADSALRDAMWIKGGDVFRSKGIDIKADERKVRLAHVYVSGLGYNEISIDGVRLDERFFDPAWTNFNKTVLYTAYDVMDRIQGKKMIEIEIELGNGWYMYQNRYGYLIEKTLKMFLYIIYENGEIFTFKSNVDNFMVSNGTIISDSIYNGVIVDSRINTEWRIPENNKYAPQGVMKLQKRRPVVKREKFVPISIKKVDENVFVVDFGQNFAGICNLSIKKKLFQNGDNVTLRHAEVLKGDGHVDQTNLRTAKSRDVYIFNGNEGIFSFQPKFTYHGFRYVQLEFNSNVKVQKKDFSIFGLLLFSDIHEIGSFNTDYELFNRIHKNILYTEKSNKMGNPLSCAARDERTPWLADVATLTSNEALYNFDLRRLYKSFLDEIVDDQNDDGSIPDVVPFFPRSSGAQKIGDPSWAGGYLFIVYNLFKHFGEIDVVKTHYDSMKKYINYQNSVAQKINMKDFFCKFGDWADPYPTGFGHICHLTASRIFIENIRQMILFSQINRDKIFEKKLLEMEALYTKKFREAFVVYNSSHKIIGDNSQTALVLTLTLNDVLKKKEKTYFEKKLIEDIIDHKYHLRTGVFGTKYLLKYLSLNGYHDLALAVSQRITYPSYGYQIYNKIEEATTLWEIWNATNGDLEIHLPYASRNHPMFGSIGEWFYEEIAGINRKISFEENNNYFEEIYITPKIFSPLLPSKIAAKSEGVMGEVLVNIETKDHNFCRIVDKNDLFSIKCPDNSKVSSIDFASYGKPTGRCDSKSNILKVHKNYHAENTMKIINSLCMHKNNCSFTVTDEFFSIQSENNWYLIVEGRCDYIQKEIDISVSIPMNSIGKITIPYENREFVIYENDTIIFQSYLGMSKTYLGDRIYKYKENAKEKFVTLHVVSGDYYFRLVNKSSVYIYVIISLSVMMLCLFIIVVIILIIVSVKDIRKKKDIRKDYSFIN